MELLDDLLPADDDRPFRSLGRAPDRRAWLERRREGIGGSDASAIVGLNPWKDERDVFDEKLGDITELHTAPIRFGHLMESRVREALHGEALYHDCELHDGAELGTLQSIARPWQLAHLDGMCVDEDGTAHGVEIKTCAPRSFRRWSGGVPDYYVCQVQHYMAVTGWQHFDVWLYVPPCGRRDILAVYDQLSEETGATVLDELVGAGTLYHFNVPRLEKWIERLTEREEEFWREVCAERNDAAASVPNAAPDECSAVS